MFLKKYGLNNVMQSGLGYIQNKDCYKIAKEENGFFYHVVRKIHHYNSVRLYRNKTGQHLVQNPLSGWVLNRNKI